MGEHFEICINIRYVLFTYFFVFTSKSNHLTQTHPDSIVCYTSLNLGALVLMTNFYIIKRCEDLII